MPFSRGMRTASDQSARPTAIRSVLRKLQPVAARTKAMRARISSSVSNVMAGYCASPDFNLSRGTIAERACRHEPGEHVVREPAGDAQRITRQQTAGLFHRRPVDADAAPGRVRLVQKRPVYDRVPSLAHPAVEGDVLRLEDVELLF